MKNSQSRNKVALHLKKKRDDAAAAAAVGGGEPAADEKSLPSRSNRDRAAASSPSSSRARLPKRATVKQEKQDGGTVDLKLNGNVRKGTIVDFRRGLLSWDIMAELEAEVRGCRQAYESQNAGDFVNFKVPDTFPSFELYLAVWTPLVVREHRAQLLNQILSESPDPAVPVHFSPSARQAKASPDDLLISYDASIDGKLKNRYSLSNGEAVLLLAEEDALMRALDLKPGDATLSSAQFGRFQPDISLRGMLGICVSTGRGRDGLRILVHASRSKPLMTSAKTHDEMSGVKILYMHTLGPMVSAQREWEALNNLDTIPLAKEILLGTSHSSGGHSRSAEVEVATPFRDEMGGLRPMSNEISSGRHDFSPASTTTTFSSASDGKARQQQQQHNVSDESFAGNRFNKWVQERFNPSQQEAIKAAEAGEGFTLIKGPPGTGKTTTLLALLNALHVREFNRYYEGILSLSNLSDTAQMKVIWPSIRRKKPHLLVTAPSNVAVDNIVQRIMSDGFLDGNGGTYRPSIVRVGRRNSSDVSVVTLDEQVSAIISKPTSWKQERIKALSAMIQSLGDQVIRSMSRLHAMVVAMSDGPLPEGWELRLTEGGMPFYVNHKSQSTQFDRPPTLGENEVGVGLLQMQEWHVYAAALTKAVEDWEMADNEKSLVNFSLQDSLQDGNSENVRCSLEASILDKAHIVLTTLNSSAQPCMSHCRPFQVVVVDEAAQSVEISSLIPLQHATRHCVLVGDPQQLSATVFTQNGSATLFDRSLFQRLEQCGHPVHMLNTQYRMHPAISKFPRHAFYNAKLLDGPNVAGPVYSQDFHRYRAFQPFVFFNMRNSVSKSGMKSLCNPSEAQLAVNVFNTLVTLSRGDIIGRVGVITPYNQQVKELKDQFYASIGGGWRDQVEISSVDGFQGREKEVIIVSLVRAQGKGVGFLADIRRMCVSLTRAKYYMCVIGHEDTLKVNPLWQKLIEEAKAAEVFISIENPRIDLLSLDEVEAGEIV